MEIVSETKSHGGRQLVVKHASEATGTNMTFSIFLPPQAENGGKTPIAILVNDTVIYQGGNPLPKDDWRGPTAPWGTASIPIPAGVLKRGHNTLTFKNMSPTANFNEPPYFMLDQATILLARRVCAAAET